jgi:hypothetical protein
MDLEKIEPPEDTRLSITDYGNFDNTKEQMEATDNEDNIEKHRKSIDRIFVSQYINDTDNEDYIVTYSEENNSILGWYVNIEKNKHIQPKSDVYFRLDQSYNIMSYMLCKKILLLFYYKDGATNHCKYLLTQLMEINKNLILINNLYYNCKCRSY